MNPFTGTICMSKRDPMIWLSWSRGSMDIIGAELDVQYLPRSRFGHPGTPCMYLSNVLTLAPLGGGGQRAPCGFSQIAPEVLGISLWNLPYLSGQQFHTLCQKIRTQVIIGQPWVTSEWRHVLLILTNEMSLRESPPLVQFWSYDQLTYMKWRRISRATKLLSRIFKILKILKKNEKNIHFFLFETVSPKLILFLSKSAEHDVTLKSITADLLWLGTWFFATMCGIVARRGMVNLESISALVSEIF